MNFLYEISIWLLIFIGIITALILIISVVENIINKKMKKDNKSQKTISKGIFNIKPKNNIDVQLLTNRDLAINLMSEISADDAIYKRLKTKKNIENTYSEVSQTKEKVNQKKETTPYIDTSSTSNNIVTDCTSIMVDCSTSFSF